MGLLFAIVDVAKSIGSGWDEVFNQRYVTRGTSRLWMWGSDVCLPEFSG
jgi:hypothetical protein